MRAQLRYYFKIDPDQLDDDELIRMHAELQYVRKLENDNQPAIPGLTGNEEQ